jgi:hypothetical protein
VDGRTPRPAVADPRVADPDADLDPGLAPEDAERGKAESYLLSSAAYWLDVYHVDGLRIITSRLRNRAGHGNTLLQAAEVLQCLQTELVERFPRARILTGWSAGNDPSAAHVVRLPGR